MREQLSNRFIRGRGVEIGGLHCPLPVPPGVHVTYVDYASADEVAKANPNITPVVKENVIDNAETLSTFADESQDFVIANHVLEHCENPIKAFHAWMRILKPGGVIYAAIPDKHQTFDVNRKVTSLEHIIKDYCVGPDWSLEEHYRDWYMNSLLEGVTGEELEIKVASSMKTRNNIHFHVFDWASLEELLRYFQRNCPISQGILFANGSEIITITVKN